MSQSSMQDQVEELKKFGIPVKRGVSMIHVEGGRKRSPSQIGSEKWLIRWARHSHVNYPVVSRAQGIRFLANACKDLPAIVCGIGPSLDESFKALKDAQGKAVIIAADAAFRPLVANGIEPDLVVSFDCKPEQKLLWEGLPKHDIPLLLDSCAHPDVISSWQGPVLFFNHYHMTDEFSQHILPSVYPHIGQVPSSGTVGNAAAMIARMLGCTPVITMGMDLCYRKTDKGWLYRAQDYAFVKAGECPPGDSATVAGMPDRWVKHQVKVLYDNDERVARAFDETVKGATFKVDPELSFYYQTLVGHAKHFKIEIVNTVGTGRLAADFPTMTPQQAVEKYCSTPLQMGRHTLKFLHVILKDPRNAQG